MQEVRRINRPGVMRVLDLNLVSMESDERVAKMLRDGRIDNWELTAEAVDYLRDRFIPRSLYTDAFRDLLSDEDLVELADYIPLETYGPAHVAFVAALWGGAGLRDLLGMHTSNTQMDVEDNDPEHLRRRMRRAVAVLKDNDTTMVIYGSTPVVLLASGDVIIGEARTSNLRLPLEQVSDDLAWRRLCMGLIRRNVPVHDDVVFTTEQRQEVPGLQMITRPVGSSLGSARTTSMTTSLGLGIGNPAAASRIRLGNSRVTAEDADE